MKKILVAIAVITAIVCFNSCEENYFELPTTHTNFIDSTKSQREWLIEFYNFYNGDEWINNENWCSPYPLNTWYGIETDSNGYVTAIRLPNNNLNRNDYKQFNFNQVPYLRILDLSNNGLVIPSFVYSKIISLEYLDISGNKCTYINLGGTRLTNLKYFDISNNDTIIDLLFIHDLPNLETLKLYNITYNGISLHGHTCPKLKLKHLDISHNNGDGSDGIFITGWDSLQSVDASYIKADFIGIHSAKNLKKIKTNNMMLKDNIFITAIGGGVTNMNIDSIDISNSTMARCIINDGINLTYLNASNVIISEGLQIYEDNLREFYFENSTCSATEGSHILYSSSLETVDLRNSSSNVDFYIGGSKNDTLNIKNFYLENAVMPYLFFRQPLKHIEIPKCNINGIGSSKIIDSLTINNYNENTLSINDCNYLDVYNSKIGFNKLNTVNKKANFVNSVCDNLVYNNFANGCYLNFENTILNQINGNADAEPVNANCSFYQSYTEWYNHFPR